MKDDIVRVNAFGSVDIVSNGETRENVTITPRGISSTKGKNKTKDVDVIVCNGTVNIY